MTTATGPSNTTGLDRPRTLTVAGTLAALAERLGVPAGSPVAPVVASTPTAALVDAVVHAAPWTADTPAEARRLADELHRAAELARLGDDDTALRHAVARSAARGAHRTVTVTAATAADGDVTPSGT